MHTFKTVGLEPLCVELWGSLGCRWTIMRKLQAATPETKQSATSEEAHFECELLILNNRVYSP